MYEFVDSVATILESPRIEGIVIDEQFNASFGQVGWKRKRILTLGLPLWVILNKEEKVALIAHELAHGVNGDPNRGVIVGSAVYTLARWYSFLRPAYILDVAPGAGIFGLLMIPFNILAFCLSTLPWITGYVLIHLLWHDSQRAEYLSDSLAAKVSGSRGVISLLEKLYFGPVFIETIERLARNQSRNVKLFEELSRRAAETSWEELTRMKNEDRVEGGRLDITHPPTAYRIELLEKKGQTSLEVSQFDWTDEVEEAFRTNAQRMQARLLDEYRLHL
ncbi:MAG: M48 family metallopeptidase [Chloroflexota bacterium]|nr:M48 family metallopeptidase [Chloroflexota bacterium]